MRREILPRVRAAGDSSPSRRRRSKRTWWGGWRGAETVRWNGLWRGDIRDNLEGSYIGARLWYTKDLPERFQFWVMCRNAGVNLRCGEKVFGLRRRETNQKIKRKEVLLEEEGRGQKGKRVSEHLHRDPAPELDLG